MRKALGAAPSGSTDEVTKDYVDVGTVTKVATNTSTFTASPGTLHIINFAASLGAVACNLPTTPAQGTKISFLRQDANGFTSFANITPGGSDTLQGGSPFVLTGTSFTATFVYVGTTWYTFSNGFTGLSNTLGASTGAVLTSTLMLRNSSGRSAVSDPVNPTDVANKEYVDAIRATSSTVSITTTATATSDALHIVSISANTTVTLPSAPADGTVCEFVRIDSNLAPSLTIQAGGSDTMSGSSPFVLKPPNSVTLVYYATSTVWVQRANTMNGLSGLLSASNTVGLGSNLVSRDGGARFEAADPVSSLQVANKEYVDIAVATAMQFNGAFSNTAGYAANDVVIYNNTPYVCTTASPAPVASSMVGSTTFSSNTLAAQNVTLPAGCLAGDAVYLAWTQDSATVPTTPITGATRQGSVVPGNNSVFGFEFTYVLTSTDITNGFVALVSQTNGTTYAGVMWVARACTVSISAANFYTTNLITNAIGTPSGYPVFTVHATASLTTGTAVITQANLTGLTSINSGTTHTLAIGSGYETLSSSTPPARTFTWTNRSTGGGGLTLTMFFVQGGGGTNSTPDADPTHWTCLASEWPGVIKMHGSVTPPPGYLLCDGSAISRTTYAVLFGIIGTTYGAGNGSTTFNLPNMASAFPQGNTPGATGGTATHTHTSAAHTHTSAAHSHPLSTAGYAQFFVSGGGGVAGRTVSVTAWTDQASASVGATATSISRTAGSPLAGATDSTTPAATGSTTPGASGSTSTLPPFVGVAFIIKT